MYLSSSRPPTTSAAASSSSSSRVSALSSGKKDFRYIYKIPWLLLSGAGSSGGNVGGRLEADGAHRARAHSLGHRPRHKD